MNENEFMNVIEEAVEQAAANMSLEDYPISEQEKDDLKGFFCQNEKVKILTMQNKGQRNNANYGRME